MVIAHSFLLHFPVWLWWLEKTPGLCVELCIEQIMHGDQRYPLKMIGMVAQTRHPSVGETNRFV